MDTQDRSDVWLRVLLAVMVAVLAFTLVATSLIFGLDVNSELVGERDGPRSSAPTTAPGPEPVAGAGPTATGHAETDAVLTEIARFVETERGLAFQLPVTVEVFDDAAFQDRLFATVAKDADDLQTDAQGLQALGFVSSVGEVERGMRALLGAGVLGFYDPETDELVVRGDGFGPMTRQTIAHELTHALDDQWFDLGNPVYDENNDEMGFGISALAEGNARRVDGAYEGQLSADDRRRLREEASSLSPPTEAIPPVLIELIRAPYDLGEPLVEALLQRGDQAELDEAFRAPPHTSEQVIDPERFFANEPAVPVGAPEADGVVLDEGMFGELMLRLLLEQGLGRGRVNRATTGWGGDRYVVWPQGDGFCLRVDIAADTPADLDEIDDALREVIKRDRPNAQIDRPQPDRVRFTSCN